MGAAFTVIPSFSVLRLGRTLASLLLIEPMISSGGGIKTKERAIGEGLVTVIVSISFSIFPYLVRDAGVSKLSKKIKGT